MQQRQKTFFSFLLVWALVFSGPLGLWAQAPDSINGGGGFLNQIFTGPDTFDVSYFYIDNPLEVFSYEDTLLNNYFQQPQPSRHRDLELIDLGSVGTPQQQLVFQPNFRRGYDIGLHQFDGYRTSSDQLPFYKIKDAFTDATFAQGRQQDDQLLTTKFSRNFGPQVNFTIDLLKVNYGGDFKNLKSNHTAFGTGFWYHHPRDIYDGYFMIVSNSNFQNHNGGVDLTLVNDVNRASEETVPVKLEGIVNSARANALDAAAQTRYRSQEIAYAHYFRLNGPSGKPKVKKVTRPAPLPPDSLMRKDTLLTIDSLNSLDTLNPLDTLKNLDSLNLKEALPTDTLVPVLPAKIRRPWKREFLVYHKISYTNNQYKFADTQLAADSSFYGVYQVHNQGLRYYISEHVLENAFRIGTSKLNPGGAKSDKAPQKKGRFEVGMIHRLIRLEQEPLAKNTLNNLLLTAYWNYAPTPQLQLKSYAHYSLGQNVGDYYVTGDLSVDFGKLGSLEAKVIQQLYAPSLIQTRMYVTSHLIWAEDFKKTFETTLAATYRLQKYGTEISGQYHLLNNYIYFDTLAHVQQTGLAISIPQLIVKQNFRLGSLHLDNVFAWQLSSEQSILPLPNLYGKHSLYLQGKIFRKAMLARFGVDLRWNSYYRPNAYQQLFGQFHLQDQQEVGYYPLLDVFFSLKVKTLRAFIKGENIAQFFTPDFVYQTPDYPIPYFMIRFGLSWRFLN